MKKLALTIAIATILSSTPAMAQIFLDDSELNTRAEGESTLGAIIPEENVTYDQFQPFAPIGEGVLLLAGLAGAYLIGKRNKKE